nr:hypothetical protein KXZ65_15600 [Pectobacterium sp. PL152]
MVFANEVPSWLGDDRITLYPDDIEYAEEYQLVVSDSLTYDQLAERLVQKVFSARRDEIYFQLNPYGDFSPEGDKSFSN